MFTLDSLMTYATKWNVVSENLLSDIDPRGFKNIEAAEVVEKEQTWGTSVSICLFMKGGGTKFIPLSNQSSLKPGNAVDVNSLKIIELERDGETCHKGDGERI